MVSPCFSAIPESCPNPAASLTLGVVIPVHHTARTVGPVSVDTRNISLPSPLPPAGGDNVLPPRLLHVQEGVFT
jgi:hypothetical protein